jgi:hypothetical protein
VREGDLEGREVKVLVCDDDGNRAKDWRDDIEAVLTDPRVGGSEGSAEVSYLKPSELAQALTGLAHRQRTARGVLSGDGGPIAEVLLAKIDSADVLVVDHDLTPAEPDPATDPLQGRSGEGFALLARCFSSAGLIVLVNKGVQSSTFDLTMTRFADSYADLNVTQEDLNRPALWHARCDGRPFRPSHWPLASEGASRLAQIAAELDLDGRVLETLGLSDAVNAFEVEQLDVLGDDPEAETFRSLARRPGVGLGLRDEQPDEAIMRLIAVHGVARWLTTTVLPGQNVLVDAAHLLEREPGLRVGGEEIAGSKPADFHDLDAVIRFAPGIDRIREQLAVTSRWLGRPVWLWTTLDPSLLADEAAQEADLVVCEDTTELVPIEAAREYEAAVSGPYLQRFVSYLQGVPEAVAYMPRNRLR